jgi:hypothetical protein
VIIDSLPCCRISGSVESNAGAPHRDDVAVHGRCRAGQGCATARGHRATPPVASVITTEQRALSREPCDAAILPIRPRFPTVTGPIGRAWDSLRARESPGERDDVGVANSSASAPRESDRKNRPSRRVISAWQGPVFPGAGVGTCAQDRLLDRDRGRYGFAATPTTDCSPRCAGIGVGPASGSSSLSWRQQRVSRRSGSFLPRSR